VTDPFSVLGLERGATLADVRAARRRLAFEAHPDRGGDELKMREINAAFDAAVAHLTGRRPLESTAKQRDAGAATTEPRRSAPFDQRRRPRERVVPGGRRVQHDAPSFVIEALPAEAFEALLVVTSWIGEALVDDPPYLLEVHLSEPARCWCRLDLVPDAGSSTVSITVVGIDGELPPDVEAVRDVWVTNLNNLGRLES
jgi:hypothetical protein